jgi:DNA-directed RNA polymerase specialized sigma24 family protein
MSSKQFDELLAKLDTLIRLTAINVLKGKTKTEAVGILTELGFTQSEIASLLRTTVGSVKSMKHSLRRKASQSKRSKKGGR